MTDNREAKPRAADLSRPRRIGAIEALKDVRQVDLVDTDAVVCNLKDRITIVRSDTDDHVAARPCVANRILGEVLYEGSSEGCGERHERRVFGLDVQEKSRGSGRLHHLVHDKPSHGCQVRGLADRRTARL